MYTQRLICSHAIHCTTEALYTYTCIDDPDYGRQRALLTYTSGRERKPGRYAALQRHGRLIRLSDKVRLCGSTQAESIRSQYAPFLTYRHMVRAGSCAQIIIDCVCTCAHGADAPQHPCLYIGTSAHGEEGKRSCRDMGILYASWTMYAIAVWINTGCICEVSICAISPLRTFAARMLMRTRGRCISEQVHRRCWPPTATRSPDSYTRGSTHSREGKQHSREMGVLYACRTMYGRVLSHTPVC